MSDIRSALHNALIPVVVVVGSNLLCFGINELVALVHDYATVAVSICLTFGFLRVAKFLGAVLREDANSLFVLYFAFGALGHLWSVLRHVVMN